MAKDYTKTAATAKRLIEKYGRTVTLYKDERDDAVAGEPWGPPVPGTSEEITTVIGVFVPVGGGGFGFELRDKATKLDVTLEQEFMVATTSATAAELKEADSMSDGSRGWKIVVRQELKPGDTSLLFSFGVVS